MSKRSSQVWLVTGANRGLGAAIAKKALACGYKVVAAARKPESIKEALGRSSSLLAATLDLTEESQIQSTVKEAIDKFGKIDVLVNNAGYGLLGFFEEFSNDAIRRQMETNVFGVMNLTRAVLPFMRKQGSGWIVNFSSIAGVKAVEGSSVYSASNFAIEGWTEGLAIELKPFGIQCLIVEPGAFRTGFFDKKESFVFAKGKIKDYNSRRGELLEHFVSYDQKQAGDPARLAMALMNALNADNPPLRLLCGKYAAKSIDNYLTRRRVEFDAWRHVTENTDFDE